jgi:hypothetical protein
MGLKFNHATPVGGVQVSYAALVCVSQGCVYCVFDTHTSGRLRVWVTDYRFLTSTSAWSPAKD